MFLALHYMKNPVCLYKCESVLCTCEHVVLTLVWWWWWWCECYNILFSSWSFNECP